MPECIHETKKDRWRVKRLKKEIRFIREHRTAVGWIPAYDAPIVIPTKILEGMLSVLKTVPIRR